MAQKLSTSGEEVLPIGGRYRDLRHQVVSGSFIDSLKADGVSAGTIHAIEQDNEKREPGEARGAATAN